MAPKYDTINRTPAYSVVIPVYNSESSLPELYRRLSIVFNSLGAAWEIILVNDCSRDNSWEAMRELAREHDNVSIINHWNNFGQHNAIMTGLRYASGAYVITMDDDLQHPPEEIPKLIQSIKSGKYSVVYGQYLHKQHGWFRDLVSKEVNRFLSWITGTGYSVTSFRILDRNLVQELLRYTQYNVMIDVFIKDTVSRREVGHCLVEHHLRTIGKSNYSFRKLFWYAVNMVFNYTIWPLRVATILGFCFSFVGIALAIGYFWYYLSRGISVSGWTSLFLSITIFSGIILFVMGIIGEYIGRTFLILTRKPQQVVKEAVLAYTPPRSPGKWNNKEEEHHE